MTHKAWSSMHLAQETWWQSDMWSYTKPGPPTHWVHEFNVGTLEAITEDVVNKS